jgi:hypothetical protein
VFRVQHFETHQQQDIYSLRLGRDETIMMCHIRYLVALLQREAVNSNWNVDKGHKEDKDKPSDCSNRDKYEDKDDDRDGANKEWY